MKQIFKTEMKRAMSGKGMVLSMLIGTVLGIAHVIREIIPAYRANLTNFYNEFPILSPHSAVETWKSVEFGRVYILLNSSDPCKPSIWNFLF